MPNINQLKKDVDIATANELGGDSIRHHLGLSVAGRKCSREIWYGWRWAHVVRHTGRILRLFNRGHLEEPRIIRWLALIGAHVREIQPLQLLYHPESSSYCWLSEMEAAQALRKEPLLQDVTENSQHLREAAACGTTQPKPSQYRVEDWGGHIGGSCDGLISGLDKYGMPGEGICEFKTHNTKSFCLLADKGVISSKPEHYIQMQLYMHYFDKKWALYVAVNKNDDDLYYEKVVYNSTVAQQWVDKIHKIASTPNPPPRINEDPSWWVCRMCDFKRICHEGHPPDQNCRTCYNAEPILNIDGKGVWWCAKWGTEIPKDQQVMDHPCWEDGINGRYTGGG